MVLFHKKIPFAIRKIHVRVYRYRFKALPEFDSVLDENEMQALFEVANAIWQPAGIKWILQSIVAMDVNDKPTAFEDGRSRAEFRQELASISPALPPVMAKRLWKVCLLYRFPISSGGVYLPETGSVFFSELARKGVPSAAILAHELGHSLGLGHVSEDGNLMNPESLRHIHKTYQHSARLGHVELDSVLTTEQITCARSQADLGPKTIE